MAFANISAFYFPSSANGGSSLWATNVRKLLDSAEAGGGLYESKTDHGTGGAVTRTVGPYVTSTSDTDETARGWAVTASDMNSVSGARRFFKSGNHVATWAVRNETTAVGKSGCRLDMFIYRVSSAAAGRTRTLLGSASSSSFSTGNANVATLVNVTVTLGEIVLDPDESIQYSFELNAPGTAVTGEIYGLRMPNNTANTQPTRIDHAGLGVLADTDGSSAGVGAATGIGAKLLGTVGSSAGAGSATGVGGATAATVGAASGIGTATGVGRSTAATTGTAAGTGTASGAGGKVIGTVGTCTIGGTTTTRVIRRIIYDKA